MTKTKKHKTGRRWPQRILISFGILFALIFVVLGSSVLWLKSESGRNWVVGKLVTVLAAGDGRATIESLEGNPLGAFQVLGLSLDDGDGVWLSVKEMEADWAPLSLLWGDVDILFLKSDSVLLLRLPKASEKEKDKDAWTPSAVTIGNLLVRLQTPVGVDEKEKPLAYEIRSQELEISEKRIELEASLISLNGKGDNLQVAARWIRGQNDLALNATLKGAQGGVLEEVLGLGGSGPITAEVNGEGLIRDWQGYASFTLGSGWTFDSRLAGRGENLLGIEGQASYPRSRNQPWTSLLGVQGTFTGSLEISEILPPVLDVTIGLPGADALVQGRVNPKGGAFLDGMEFAFTAPRVIIPVSETENLEIIALSGQGVAAGKITAPTLSGEYAFQGIEGAPLNMAAAGGAFSVIPDKKNLVFHLAGTGRAFSWLEEHEEIMNSRSAEWNVDGNLENSTRRLVLDLGHLNLDWLSVAGGGVLDSNFKPEKLDLDGTLDTSGLSDLSKAPGLQGVAQFNVRLTAEPGPSDVFLSAEIANFKSGFETADMILGSDIAFELEGEIFFNGDFNFRNATLTGQNINLGAAGRVTSTGALTLDYVAGFSSLIGIAPPAFQLDGGILIAGHISGNYDNPSLVAETTLARVNLWGFEIEGLHVGLALASLFDNPRGPLTLSSQTTMGQANAKTMLAWLENGDVEARDIALDISSLRISGGLMFLTGAGVRGNLIGTFYQEDVVLPGQYLRGEGDIHFSFDIAGADQRIDFTSSLVNLEARESSGLLSEMGALTGSGYIIFADETVAGLDLNVGDFYRGALWLEAAEITATRGKTDTMKVSAAGQYYEPFEFSIESHMNEEVGKEQTIHFDLSADYGGRNIRSLKPLSLNMSNSGQHLDFPSLQIGAGTLSGFVYRAEGVFRGEVSASGLDVVLLTLPWRRLVSSGTLSGELAIDFSEGSEFLLLNVEAENLRQQDVFEIEEEPFTLKVKAGAEDGWFEGEGILSRKGAEIGIVKSSFSYSRTPAFAIDPAKPLRAALFWDGPVEPLWGLARLNDHDLEGYFRGEVRVTGSVDTPLFSGMARLEQGTYSYLPSGLALQDVSLAVAGSGDTLIISSFQASDGEGGMLKAAGSFEISPQGLFPGTLEIDAERLAFVNLDSVRANASGSLVYVRSEQAAALSGKVTTGRIEAEITQRLPKSVISIDVREINLPVERSPTQGAGPAIRRAPVALDLSIIIPDQFFVRGRGLESEWQGDLSVSGTADEPLIAGTLSLVRGNFDFGGKRFSLDSGRLFFDGGRDVDPEIELVSRTRTSTIDAEIRISGNLSSPQVTMSSVPVLPEDEILSHLLFGSSVTELSPLQLAELASALATISGEGGGLNFLSVARKRIGLDLLLISTDPDQENGTIITGGKYLTRDVYLEVETATATGETITRLLYDISKRFRAESEVGQKKGSSLKLKWFWDY